MDILADLNEPQRQAVTHVDGPLLVLAGAGSGKTRVITRRVAYLIRQGVAPGNVLAITFTNRAAGEMRTRIAALGVGRGATVCTFHSLCARLLREFATLAGVSTNYTIYDRADQLRITTEALRRLELPTDRLSPSAVHGTISNAKNQLKTVQVFGGEAGDFYTRNVAKVFGVYEQMLAANNALDFDDLLGRMAFLMRDHPDIRQMLGRRYRYILIDEYQDTNRAQYILAHGIAMDHQNICVTGDPDQSIYAWRGADIKNILEFETDYPDAKVVRLEENYRSTECILKTASRLISHNTLRKEKDLWTQRSGGRDIHVVRCDDEHAEAANTAARIAELHRGDLDYSDMAVFYRVNSLSRVLEEALIRASIPYRIARGVEFYNRKEIKDVLAYLKVLVNPADDLSCLRIINTPPRGIGDVTIKRLNEFAVSRGVSLLAAAGRAGEAGLSAGPGKKVSAFCALIASLAGDLDRLVREVTEDVVRRSGLEASLSSRDEEHRQARANVAELISTAAEFDAEADGGLLSDYLHQISLVADADHFDGSAGAVSLMTLHAAKGLEFPAVFIVGCEEGLLPFTRGDWGNNNHGDSDRDLEEERRLAFVGMTRAKDLLTLSHVRRRMIRGRTMPSPPSQFLGEIGQEFVTIQDKTTPIARTSLVSAGGGRGGFYGDVDDRSIIEAAQEAHPFPPEYEHLTPGCMVHHGKFGVGRIVSMRQPWPETRAVVEFRSYGQKTLVLRWANLELMDTD